MLSISHTKIHYLCISSIAIFIVLFPLACNSQKSIETDGEFVTQEDSNASNMDISPEVEKIDQNIVELETIPTPIISIQPTDVPVPSSTVTVFPTRMPTPTVDVKSPDQVIESSGNDKIDVPEYMKNVWLCTGPDNEEVDDLTTPDAP